MNRGIDALRQADLAMGLSWAPRAKVEARAPASPGPSATDAPGASVTAPPERRPAAPSDPIDRPAHAEAPRARASAESAPAAAAVTLPSALPANARASTPASPPERARALEQLRERHERECPHCTTATAHTHTVFGEGDPMARLMFVGEAPGETEDRTGRPFVGRAGEKLDEMIRAMGLSREQVYIANVLKSRPPENRTPLQHEVDGCGPYLIEQLLVIRPEVIVSLGGPATKLLLGTDAGITRLRGAWSQWSPPEGCGAAIPVMPTYHPAYLLRNYTPKTRGEVWSDLQAVMARLGISRK